MTAGTTTIRRKMRLFSTLTLVPGAFNSLSMWCVRLPLAAFLAGRHGLRGVWEAIAVELVVRGCFALARLRSSGWSGGATRADAAGAAS